VRITRSRQVMRIVYFQFSGPASTVPFSPREFEESPP